MSFAMADKVGVSKDSNGKATPSKTWKKQNAGLVEWYNNKNKPTTPTRQTRPSGGGTRRYSTSYTTVNKFPWLLFMYRIHMSTQHYIYKMSYLFFW